jgi:hypothetical protein
VAPAGTSQSIVARLHHETARALTAKDVLKRLGNAGMEVVANTPPELRQSSNQAATMGEADQGCRDQGERIGTLPNDARCGSKAPVESLDPTGPQYHQLRS